MLRSFLRSDAAHIFLLVVVVFGLFSPMIFGGMVAADEERIGLYYPLVFFYQRALNSDSGFLWDPTHYGGFPSYLNMFAGMLYPVHYVLIKFLPAVNFYGLAIALAAAGGVAFSYLFGRSNNLSSVASVILAFGYFTGQSFGGFNTGLSYANGFLVLPLMLYAILRARKSESKISFWGWAGLGSIGSTIGFLAGFPQTVLYGMAFAGLYALYIDYYSGAENILQRLRGTIAFVFMAGSGALFALPQLIASFNFIPYSVRTSDYAAQVSEGIRSTQFLSLLLPGYIRIPLLTSGASGIFIGTLGIFFAAFVLVCLRDREVKFWGASYFAMLAMALAIPGVSVINNYLPIFSRVSNVARWMLVAVFPLSFLAAKGFDLFSRMSAEDLQYKKIRILLRASGSIALLAPIALGAAALFTSYLAAHKVLQERILAFLLKGKPLLADSAHYNEVFIRTIEDMGSIFNFFDWRFIFLFATFPVAFVVIYRFIKTRDARIFSRNVFVFVISSTIIFAVSHYEITFIGGKIFREKPGVIRFWEERGERTGEFRFINFLAGDGIFREILAKRHLSLEEQSIVHRENLTGQASVIWGDYENMQGFEPLRSLRANQLIDTVISPQALKIFDPELLRSGGRIDQKENSGVLRDAGLEEKSADFIRNTHLLSMMNVKYIVSLYPLEDLRIKEVVLEKNDIYGATLRLYENTDVMPRVYFAKDPVFWDGSNEELIIAIAGEQDFRARTYIEDCKGCGDGGAADARDDVKVLHNENGRVEIRARTENGRWLVVSNSNLPGWVAEIDGKRADIHMANYLFQAVFVPAGMHEVLFEYRGSFRLFLERLGF